MFSKGILVVSKPNWTNFYNFLSTKSIKQEYYPSGDWILFTKLLKWFINSALSSKFSSTEPSNIILSITFRIIYKIGKGFSIYFKYPKLLIIAEKD